MVAAGNFVNGSPEANGLQTFSESFTSPFLRLAYWQADKALPIPHSHSYASRRAARKIELSDLVFFWIAGQFQQAIVWKQPLCKIEQMH